jgi:hypothetical protein
MMMNKEQLLDTHLRAQVSDINLESPNSQGDIAITGFILDEPYDDFVFANYIDVDNGFITDEKSGLVRAVSDTNKTWRKAEVIKVGPACRTSKPGTIILFPNDKGLPCGEVEYYDTDGKVQMAKNGIFLGEHRIFATVTRA